MGMVCHHLHLLHNLFIDAVHDLFMYLGNRVIGGFLVHRAKPARNLSGIPGLGMMRVSDRVKNVRVNVTL